MWHSYMVHMTHKHPTDQEVYALIQVLSFSTPWFFTVIYASMNISKRFRLWNNLSSYANALNGARLVARYFNEIFC